MAATPAISFDPRRFEELILLLAKLSEEDEHFGATKLNKLLFYCDFLAYAHLGAPLTGAPYQKLEYGPAPRPLKPTLAKLVREGRLAEEQRDRFSLQQKRPVALREADRSLFSEDEIELIESMVAKFRSESATAISDLSHQLPGWKLARKGETIPYGTVRLGTRAATPAEVEYAKSLVGVAKAAVTASKKA